MAGSRPLLLAASALTSLALLAAAPAGARTLVAPDTPVRAVVLPLSVPGEALPPPAELDATLHRAAALLARVSQGRLRLTWVTAPPSPLGRPLDGRPLQDAEVAGALRAAVAQGVPVDGAIPLVVAAARGQGVGFGGSDAAELHGDAWRYPSTTVHELLHVMGADHARAPATCPRPFRALACLRRPLTLSEYGDVLDLMGDGEDDLGAFPLAALGLAPVRDAPPGTARIAVRPVDGRRPTLLRLRAAARDWFVESRRTAAFEGGPPLRMPAGVAIARVEPVYEPRLAGYFPEPERLPATGPRAGCRPARACLARTLLRPGKVLTVPGAFRLRVLGRTAGGAIAVRTTWLDRTAPALTVAGASIVRPFGATAELTLEVRAAAAGAGVSAVTIDQAGSVSRIDADAVPGLVAGAAGAGTVRVPLVPGAVRATVRVVDAAGNVSAPTHVDLAALPSATAATIAVDPAPGAHPAQATPLAGGQALAIRGSTDPALAGLSWHVSIDAVTRVGGTVAADGTFAGSATPPGPGHFGVTVHVPLARGPGPSELRRQTLRGWVRA